MCRPSEAYGAGRGVIFRKIKHHLTSPTERKTEEKEPMKKKKGGEIDLGKCLNSQLAITRVVRRENATRET